VETLIPTLALLACPVGMGAMMWFMVRGSKSGSPHSSTGAPSLAELREEQRRIAADIDRLEDGSAEHGALPAQCPRPGAA